MKKQDNLAFYSMPGGSDLSLVQSEQKDMTSGLSEEINSLRICF